MPWKYNRHLQAMQWLVEATELNEGYEPSKDTFIPRGRIVNVRFGENVGFEKNSKRPAVIVSVDSSNQRSGNVIVVPLTTKSRKTASGKGLRLLKSQYLLKQDKYPGLSFDSIVQCEDIRSVSKARLEDLLDTVNEEDMQQIDRRLSYILDLK